MNDFATALDLLRWRSVVSEPPKQKGRYLVATQNGSKVETHVSYFSLYSGWATAEAGITHWRPIGPMPEVGG